MKLSRAHRIHGRLRLPGDKSISHRAAIIASIASGRSIIKNYSTAVDCSSTLACLKQLGVRINRSGSVVEIDGAERLQRPDSPLDCGNSGTTIRVLSGVLARQDFSCELSGDSSLNSRPMGRIIQPLELMGARFESTDGKPPLTVHGATEINPIIYELPVASAQVKSAILFAALGAQRSHTG